jgi:hypothetical protein
MSVKELLKKSSAQFLDISPVLPDGVRIVTREKSASEQAREERPLSLDKHRG